eukprot:5778017-Amphidinium_carterae.1
MTRTQVVGIESRCGGSIPHGHVLVLFALPHAARCMNNFRTGADGRTPEELRTGRPWKKTMA